MWNRAGEKRTSWKRQGIGCLALFAVVAAACSQPAPPPVESKSAPPAQAVPPAAHGSETAAAPRGPAIPPYYDSAEAAKPFPRLMPVERYRDYPVIARTYEIAHRRPEVLVQQPCYCYCEKFGHGSLLDCFASDHGAT